MIKLWGNAGYIDVDKSNIYNDEKLRELFSKSDICVNLVGHFI